MYEQYDQIEPEEIKIRNWENLSDNKCPICGLMLLEKENRFECTCSFSIHKNRALKIQLEQQQSRLDTRLRKKLQANEKIRFRETKTFTGEKPTKLNLGF